MQRLSNRFGCEIIAEYSGLHIYIHNFIVSSIDITAKWIRIEFISLYFLGKFYSENMVSCKARIVLENACTKWSKLFNFGSITDYITNQLKSLQV